MFIYFLKKFFWGYEQSERNTGKFLRGLSGKAQPSNKEKQIGCNKTILFEITAEREERANRQAV